MHPFPCLGAFLTSPATPAGLRQWAEELAVLGQHAHALLVVDSPVQLLQLHPLRGDTAAAAAPAAASPQPRDGHRGGQKRSPGRPCRSIAGRALPLVLLHAGTAPGHGPRTQVPQWLAVHGAPAAGGAASGVGGGHDVAVGVLVVAAGGGPSDERAHEAVTASEGPLTAVRALDWIQREG